MDNLDLRVHNGVRSNQLMHFAELLDRHFPLTKVDEKSYLAWVQIVRPESAFSVINSAIRQESDVIGDYPVSDDWIGAVAVPLERADSLRCAVFFSDRQLLGFEPGKFRYYEVEATIVEEFLHVQLFGLTWESVGYVQIPITTKKRDIVTTAARIHDEYYVNRRKPESLTPRWEKSGHHFEFMYGESLREFIDHEAAELLDLVEEANNGTKSKNEAWNWIIHIVGSRLFDRLARDAAFRAANPYGDHPFSDALASSFFEEKIESHWATIEDLLDSSYKHIEETNTIEEKWKVRIADEIEGFLTKIEVDSRWAQNQST